MKRDEVDVHHICILVLEVHQPVLIAITVLNQKEPKEAVWQDNSGNGNPGFSLTLLRWPHFRGRPSLLREMPLDAATKLLLPGSF